MGKGRAPCCDKSKVRTGPWSPAEDLRLINFIQKHGHSNWRALPKQAGLLRCGKSCRLRWINYLRPDVKRGNFSLEEEETIIKLHNSFGNRWSKIASCLPGRTDNEIKNVWNTHLKKRLKKTTSQEDDNSLETDHQPAKDDDHSKMDGYSSSTSTSSSSVLTTDENIDKSSSSLVDQEIHVKETDQVVNEPNQKPDSSPKVTPTDDQTTDHNCGHDQETIIPEHNNSPMSSSPCFSNIISTSDEAEGDNPNIIEIPCFEEVDVDIWEWLDTVDIPFIQSNEADEDGGEKDNSTTIGEKDNSTTIDHQYPMVNNNNNAENKGDGEEEYSHWLRFLEYELELTRDDGDGQMRADPHDRTVETEAPHDEYRQMDFERDHDDADFSPSSFMCCSPMWPSSPAEFSYIN